MGFFSSAWKSVTGAATGVVGSLLGGSGGGESSQSSNQNTTVDNNVEVNFDVDKLAETMKNNTLMDIFFKSEVAQRELTIKEKEQKTKEDSLRVSAIALKQQIKTDKYTMILTVIGIGLAFFGLFYNKLKKGKK